MDCLRCNSKMTRGYINNCIDILTKPNESNLIINGKTVAPRSAYVCDKCGYIELSNKEYDAEEDNYDFQVFIN